jgi:hypothetical protein
VLGPIRVLWVVPRADVRIAELMEFPVMLVVIIIVARWLVIRLAEPPKRSSRRGMGFIALALLLTAELALVGPMQGYSISECIAARDSVSGTVFLVPLGIFALMSFLMIRKGTARPS